jgi:hypothetical protein
MQVRYLCLKNFFSKCSVLWKKLKKFADLVDFNLCKNLQIFEKFFSKLKTSKCVLGADSGKKIIKKNLKTLGINPWDQHLNKKQLNYIKVF